MVNNSWWCDVLCVQYGNLYLWRRIFLVSFYLPIFMFILNWIFYLLTFQKTSSCFLWPSQLPSIKYCILTPAHFSGLFSCSSIQDWFVFRILLGLENAKKCFFGPHNYHSALPDPLRSTAPAVTTCAFQGPHCATWRCLPTPQMGAPRAASSGPWTTHRQSLVPGEFIMIILIISTSYSTQASIGFEAAKVCSLGMKTSYHHGMCKREIFLILQAAYCY